MNPIVFPRRFVWGVAASAPQIEGAAGGRGPSIWDRFSRVPGAVSAGDTLDVTCDHYHRFDEDFALMAKLGIRHYRMSIAWPRIIPDGVGAVNQAGVDFYHQVFDSLEKHGITPWVTMFHWDLPQALEERGGWRVRSVTDAFAHYAETIVQAYAARVKNWITLNEIFCFTTLGYGTGQKAPGAREPAAVVNQTYHHALLCHGLAVRAVRRHGGRGARVGLTDNVIVTVPLDHTPRNIAAARRAFQEANTRVLEPLFRGRYNAGYLKAAGPAAPTVLPGDLALISTPTDFIGLNIYTGQFVRSGKGGRPEQLTLPAGFPASDCAWLQLIPQALFWGPRFVHELYGPRTIYIMENGAGYQEEPVTQGEVHDLHRREYVRNCLRELHSAMKAGAPVKGYFVWSFMDNFEWEDGFAQRFGIVHNNFQTQKRTPKLSARWYAEVIRRNQLI